MDGEGVVGGCECSSCSSVAIISSLGNQSEKDGNVEQEEKLVSGCSSIPFGGGGMEERRGRRIPGDLLLTPTTQILLSSEFIPLQ